LRRNPPIRAFTKTALRKTTLGGHKIQKHQNVMISVKAIHHSNNVWKDALSFVPERWLEGGEAEKRHQYSFLPFGSGPR
jgi:cytochrome P450